MIITNNEEALRIKCEDATLEEVGPIISLLEQELEHSAKLGRLGIGLAAIQCGVAKNVAIVRIDNLYKVNLVNCRIKEGYDKTLFKDEGCLSYPGRVEDTMRYQEIHVVDNLVEPHSFIAAGLMSVVIQHELNHGDGILLPDIALAKPTISTAKYKLGPNDRCLCGKFDPPKKYKKCCGR